MKRLIVLLIVSLSPFVVKAEPLFPNSVASNNLDFIKSDDPGACWDIREAKGGRTEMYDPHTDELFVDGALAFSVSYPTHKVRINVHPSVGDPILRAQDVASSLSRLPVQMRQEIQHVNIHAGNGTAWAEDLGKFFTLYDENMLLRLSENDLDETVFHEAVHVALDLTIGRDRDWQSVQNADAAFVTHYAESKPNKEDLAESALFAWALMRHPGRLPLETEEKVRDVMPNRLEFLGNVFADFTLPSC